MENQHTWYLDSGCSKHMIRDNLKFANLLLKKVMSLMVTTIKGIYLEEEPLETRTPS